MPLSEDHVTTETYNIASAWMRHRAKKFEEHESATMAVNPLLMPIVAAMHGISEAEELTQLMTEAHLIVGHNTGFGKLIDEKLLPSVFGTTKLNKSFRDSTAPYSQSAFNDIDHLVERPSGKLELLSLKASRWTINLGGARNLNGSFAELRRFYVKPDPDKFAGIVVGVIFGQPDSLGDKYEIARGLHLRQRAKHDVTDLSDTVSVVAGRQFWAWLNEGKDETQDWVLEGILRATEEAPNLRPEVSWGERLVVQRLEDETGGLDWRSLLKGISG